MARAQHGVGSVGSVGRGSVVANSVYQHQIHLARHLYASQYSASICPTDTSEVSSGGHDILKIGIKAISLRLLALSTWLARSPLIFWTTRGRAGLGWVLLFKELGFVVLDVVEDPEMSKQEPEILFGTRRLSSGLAACDLGDVG